MDTLFSFRVLIIWVGGFQLLNGVPNAVMPNMSGVSELERAREFIEQLGHTIGVSRPALEPGSVVFYCTNPTTHRTETVFLGDPAIASKLDLHKKVGILIHGWITSANDPWCLKLAIAWARHRDYNVCRVQWMNLAFVDYFISILNISLIGDVTSQFLQQLIRNGFNLNSIVCVGHGMGAHMCGQIGAQFNGRISKIIGLDPSGLGFTIPIVSPKQFRLDKSDAQLVVSIHSGDLGLGSSHADGHQDVYINGGLTMTQRGCGPNYFSEAIFNSTMECAHYRAVQIFHVSLMLPNDECVVKSCSNLWKYFARLCYGPVDRLGLDSKGIPGEFYIAIQESPKCTGEIYLF